MEASRAALQKSKEYDPHHELWLSLVKRWSNDPSLSSWSKEEKIYFSVTLFENELYNGGFEQYFSNSSANYYAYAVMGLRDLGAEGSLEILVEAASILFGADGPPDSQQARWGIMYMKNHEETDIEHILDAGVDEHLDQLDQRFYKSSKDIADLLEAYEVKHGLVVPFLSFE
ncbi:DUF4375 domain-containing protein [Sphingomonas crocodyli]|uniref:DUF4375 domain-containing protein n=2 Tax=Sphingomonas crocodyli TaxID=1979270 RepID=A0A437MBW6_9SPHN|nr:DUF4375 domain-containing protein [Sphingomonas crocodyli]